VAGQYNDLSSQGGLASADRRTFIYFSINSQLVCALLPSQQSHLLSTEGVRPPRSRTCAQRLVLNQDWKAPPPNQHTSTPSQTGIQAAVTYSTARHSSLQNTAIHSVQHVNQASVHDQLAALCPINK
jgi:hypothetical protein